MSETKQTLKAPATGLGQIAFWSDLGKGLYYACAGQIIALLTYLGNSVMQEQPHFPNTWVEWYPYVKNIVYAAAGYVFAKFGINNVGQILQRNKDVLLVPKDHLDELIQKANKQ